jgi:hypothetical protein
MINEDPVSVQPSYLNDLKVKSEMVKAVEQLLQE